MMNNEETLQKLKEKKIEFEELLAQVKNEDRPNYNYECEQLLFDKISEHLEKHPGRFSDERNFITRSIEMILAWETDPPAARVMMNARVPFIHQLAFVKACGTPPKVIETMWDNHPNCYTENEEEIEKFLKDNPLYEIKGREIAAKTFAAMQTGNQTPTAAAAQEKERMSKADFQKLRDSQTDIINFIKNTDFKKVQGPDGSEEIFYDGWPLLWNHYTRILPAKIAIMGIADIMNSKQSDMIELDESNKAHIYDLAEELSVILREEEKKKGMKRENKLSTGLPKPPEAQYNTTREDKKRVLDAEQRYKDRILGKPRKHRKEDKKSFDGMLSALGLIRTFTDGNSNVHVTLTESGKKFCLLENPIINEDYSKALSADESHFLVTKVLLQRDLEFRLMTTAITKVKEHSKKTAAKLADELDIAFKSTIGNYVLLESTDDSIAAEVNDQIISKTEDILKENAILSADDKKKKQTPVEAYRVATMGRLAEMGVLKWTIEKDASSSYDIADQALADKILAA